MDWSKLSELLAIQFPVAALNLAAIYFAFRFIERRDARLDERTDRVRKEIREETEREIGRFREAQREQLAAKDRETDRLEKALSGQVKELAQKLNEALEKWK